MLVVGLTGGIGCGKSYVAAKMQLRGIPVYDSDSRAKLLTYSDPFIRKALTELVGPTLYCSCCGQFNKEILAKFIFGNEQNLTKVNAIIHPRVRDDFRRWKDGLNGKDICILESAILFESGFDAEADFKVCVDAPMETRIIRCMRRDGADRESVMKRISSQMDQAEKCGLCDFIVNNDGTHDIEQQIGTLIENVKKLINTK